ncbi:glycoside hydrolase family 6 protein [Streptomyces violascens]|uniref:Glucanase n=1 Tax=Streptomyces violascens TaxID=67381 RepID=A0ABQ3R011_9ACTN|nr:glycoside hydrolase family 6 protein [Streptomyces violascens]GGU14577.1 glucanase [Streptomyces violascens]GHI42866.1 glucanase [Streptomyces violascens]
MSRYRALPYRILLTAVLLTAGVGCSSGDGAEAPAPQARAEAEAAPAPAPGSPFWVDPESDAARQMKIWQAQGRTSDAQVLRRIAERPVATWPSGDNPKPGIRKAVEGAAKEKRTALFVAYNIPHRDCGKYSAGGANGVDGYRAWYGMFAEAIGDAPAVVVLEPDAVAHMVDGCTTPDHHAERYQLLNEAVEHLKRLPNTKVYLDAGNPAWIPDPYTLIEPLRRAGIDKADGFALNVSNFQTDATVRAYGVKVSQALGGKHFVMDTSRNGVGPLPGDRDQAWCNPPGRSLGTPPSVSTGDRLVDAFLWIKRPGDSDGPCRGGPSAGTWWPEYALGLAKRARF